MVVSLNEKQLEAVLHTEGPLLILAGAGAGKTKTITERIVQIVKNGTEPKNILAVTFTNKAGKEMRERILSRLEEEKIIERSNPYFSKPIIKTFHGLGLMILSEYGKFAGLLKNPTILDSQDSLSIIKGALEKLNIDPKVHDPSKIRSIISKEKGNFTSLSDYQKKIVSTKMEIIFSIWRIYENELKEQKAVDFDDLIVKAVRLLEENKEVRDFYQNRFKYIHVDEYQDTNQAQYEFIKLLINKDKNNICVVGDTDQNIYSWRGANLKNIMGFEKDFEGTHIVVLEENYRSTGNILSLANNAIKKNSVRKEKVLFTKKEGGEKIEILPAFDEQGEGELIARKSKELIETGVSPKDIAVLYRANFQSRVLEESFLREGVPYNLLGTKFFERKEVKDVLAYLRVSMNRASQVDLKRVFETPKKGIGKATIAKIFAGALVNTSTDLKIKKVYEFLDKVEEKLQNENLSFVLQMIIVESGIEKELIEGGDDGIERLENVRELVSITSKYDGEVAINVIEQFLEESSLQSDQDEDKEEKEGVRLMTIHSSKGLEFDYVFICGLEHDLFPHKNIGNKKETKEEEEEERRLFYVAVTRARKKLFLCYAEIRTIFGQRQINAPSEFLEDVEEEIGEFNETYYKEGAGKIFYI